MLVQLCLQNQTFKQTHTDENIFKNHKNHFSDSWLVMYIIYTQCVIWSLQLGLVYHQLYDLKTNIHRKHLLLKYKYSNMSYSTWK